MVAQRPMSAVLSVHPSGRGTVWLTWIRRSGMSSERAMRWIVLDFLIFLMVLPEHPGWHPKPPPPFGAGLGDGGEVPICFRATLPYHFYTVVLRAVPDDGEIVVAEAVPPFLRNALCVYE